MFFSYTNPCFFFCLGEPRPCLFATFPFCIRSLSSHNFSTAPSSEVWKELLGQQMRWRDRPEQGPGHCPQRPEVISLRLETAEHISTSSSSIPFSPASLCCPHPPLTRLPPAPSAGERGAESFPAAARPSKLSHVWACFLSPPEGKATPQGYGWEARGLSPPGHKLGTSWKLLSMIWVFTYFSK